MMDGKEKIYFLVNRIIAKDEITVSGDDILLHPANDLNKKYDINELTNIMKILVNQSVIKNVKLPSEDTNWYLSLKTASGFKSYVNKMKQEPRYQDFTGTKSKPKKLALGVDQVDFHATPKENENRYISAGQISKLYQLDENERERILTEHLTPKHRTEAEEFVKNAQRVIKNFSMPNFELPKLSPEVLTMPPNYDAEQTRLLRMIAEKDDQRLDKNLISPTYDKDKRQLVFCNTIIQIPADSDQEGLCKALFRSGKPTKKPLDIGDALLKLGVPADKLKDNKKISYAKRELNERIAKQTQIDDLFVIANRQISFNEKYV
jgi:hypothetical protein